MKFLLSAAATTCLLTSASAMACDCSNPRSCPIGVCDNKMTINFEVPIYSSAQNIWVCNAGIKNTGCAGHGNLLFFKANDRSGPGNDGSGYNTGSASDNFPAGGEGHFEATQSMQAIYGDSYYFDANSRKRYPTVLGTYQEVFSLGAALTSLNYGAEIFVDICGTAPFHDKDLPDLGGQDPQTQFKWNLAPSMSWTNLLDGSGYIQRAGLQWKIEKICTSDTNEQKPDLSTFSSVWANGISMSSNTTSFSFPAFEEPIDRQRKCIVRYSIRESKNGVYDSRIKGETEGLTWTVKLDSHIFHQ
jgi:hypothetical protein